MATANSIAATAALIGDPARAAMLLALMGGRPLSAGKLALEAGITAQTASAHLAKLADGGIVVPRRQGRHRFFRIAGPEIAELMERLMQLNGHTAMPQRSPFRVSPALKRARTCYDHLAGQLGVAVTEGLLARGHLDEDGGDFRVTGTGERFLAGFGIDLAAVRGRRRAFARACLDWSERRPHLAGALGAAVAERCLERGWVRRVPEGRALTVTRAGERGLRDSFGVEWGG